MTGYDRDTQVVIAATIHWRWLFGNFTIDAVSGSALRLDRYPPAPDPEYPGGLVSANCVGLGLFVDLGRCGGMPFDVELGFAFGHAARRPSPSSVGPVLYICTSRCGPSPSQPPPRRAQPFRRIPAM